MNTYIVTTTSTSLGTITSPHRSPLGLIEYWRHMSRVMLNSEYCADVETMTVELIS